MSFSMRRSCVVTLKFATAKKRRAISALMEAYRAAVNFYIRYLWESQGGLNKETLAKLQNTRLSERYKSQSLKQALEMVVATKKSAKATKKRVSCPVFRGSAVLDAKFVSVESGRGSFDLVVRLSTLHSGHRISIPTKRTSVLNRWAKIGAIIQGCALNEKTMTLWVDVKEEPQRLHGTMLGIDIGINKLISDSNGAHYGTEFKSIREKIRRSKPKSKARYRHYAEREKFINRTINRLPWLALSVLGVEELHDMKRGKHKRRGKSFRKAIAPWTYRRVLDRIGHKAQEHRVHLVAVPPAHTSQTCPTCHTVSSESRKGEKFQCVACNRSGDADHIGALNVLARTYQILRSIESLGLNEAVI